MLAKSNNTLKFLIPYLITYIIQIAFFCLTYEIGYFMWDNFIEEVRRNLNWGITLRFALFLFVLMSSFTALLFVKKIRYKWIITIIVFVTFELIFINNFSYTPYRYLLLSISAFLGFFIPLSTLSFIQKIIENELKHILNA